MGQKWAARVRVTSVPAASAATAIYAIVDFFSSTAYSEPTLIVVGESHSPLAFGCSVGPSSDSIQLRGFCYRLMWPDAPASPSLDEHGTFAGRQSWPWAGCLSPYKAFPAIWISSS